MSIKSIYLDIKHSYIKVPKTRNLERRFVNCEAIVSNLGSEDTESKKSRTGPSLQFLFSRDLFVETKVLNIRQSEWHPKKITLPSKIFFPRIDRNSESRTTIRELQDFYKEAGIQRFSKQKDAELVRLIRVFPFSRDLFIQTVGPRNITVGKLLPSQNRSDTPITMRDLKAFSKRLGLKEYWRLSKAKLLALLINEIVKKILHCSIWYHREVKREKDRPHQGDRNVFTIPT